MPTFGITSTGTGESNLYDTDTVLGYKATSGDGGTADSIYIYCRAHTNDVDAHGLLYYESNKQFVTNAVTDTVTVSSTSWAWREFPFSQTVVISGSTTYYIAWQQDGNTTNQGLIWSYSINSGDEDDYHRDNDTGSHFPNYPTSIIQDFRNDLTCSIYCSYSLTSTYAGFTTFAGSPTGWKVTSGQIGSQSSMRATSANPTTWEWGVISSTSTYFYPSGSPLRWKWVSGNAYA